MPRFNAVADSRKRHRQESNTGSARHGTRWQRQTGGSLPAAWSAGGAAKLAVRQPGPALRQMQLDGRPHRDTQSQGGAADGAVLRVDSRQPKGSAREYGQQRRMRVFLADVAGSEGSHAGRAGSDSGLESYVGDEQGEVDSLPGSGSRSVGTASELACANASGRLDIGTERSKRGGSVSKSEASSESSGAELDDDRDRRFEASERLNAEEASVPPSCAPLR